MRGTCISAAFVVCLLVGTTVRAQEGINATLSGTVSDNTGALIPGVEVTAKNTATGVASTTITNETGTYGSPACNLETTKRALSLPAFKLRRFA